MLFCTACTAESGRRSALCYNVVGLMAANWHTLTSDIKIIAKELASLTVLKVMNELKKTL